MHDTLIAVLVLLTSALVLGAIAEQLRQTAVLGYLIAGTVVGPNVLGWVNGADQVGALAELGASTLLFSIGTEFSVTRLRAFGGRLFAVGVLQVVVTIAAGMLAARLLGLSMPAAFAVGAIASLSSTAVVARLLVEMRSTDSAQGRAAIGVLLTQDICVVPLVVAVSVLGGTGTASDALGSIASTGLWAILLVAGFVAVVHWVVPLLLAGRSMSRNRELVAVFAAVCAIGSALGAQAAGLSPALGAFVAGVLLGGSPFAAQVRAEVAPLRTLLVTLFFAAVGLAGDPTWAWQNAGVLAAAVAAFIIGKAVIVAGIARLAGLSTGVALAAGLCLAQIGEFSFVISESAREGGLFDEGTYKLLVTATIASLAITPFLVEFSTRVANMHGPARQSLPPEESDAKSIIIVGFGPSGQRCFEELRARRGEDCVVIDSNSALVALARTMGATAHLGDAGRVDVLDHAGASDAKLVLVTMADVAAAEHVASLARTAAPGAVVIARSRYHTVAEAMLRAGAHRVVDEEQIVGERLAVEAEAALRSASDD